MRGLYFELSVKSAIIELLKSQEQQKTYEEYLKQNITFILLNYEYEIDEDPKEQLFLKEVAEKVKEEYLKVRQEKQRKGK